MTGLSLPWGIVIIVATLADLAILICQMRAAARKRGSR